MWERSKSRALTVERRLRTRYELRLPVIYGWTDEHGAAKQAGGFTRNISTQGLYVVAAELPPGGVRLRLQAVLPPLEAAAEVLPLRAAGQVLRVEGQGFALTSDFDVWWENEADAVVEAARYE